MFIIAAIVIASSLLALKVGLKAPSISEQRLTLEATLDTKIFSNIVNELKNAAKFSADQKDNMTRNVYDFGNFTKAKMGEKFFTFKFLFIGSLARVNNLMNTSVVNLLGSDKNVTLNLNGTVRNQVVADSGRWDTDFSITAGSTYVLMVSFENYSENVTIKTKSTKDVYVGFFDVYMEVDETIYRNKTQETYVLS